jgi:hypothetical protein
LCSREITLTKKPLSNVSVGIAVFPSRSISDQTVWTLSYPSLRRLLKKNGLLAIIEWAKPLGTLGPDSVHRLEPVKLQEIARVAGFRPVETFPAGEYHYCTIFRKEGV